MNKPLFSTTISIRWGEMDAYGHVNNAMYLRYMEEARIQWLYEIGAVLDGRSPGPVIINNECTFLKPVVYPDLLRVDCYADSPGRSSFMTRYKIFSQQQDNQLVSEGSAKVVWIDPSENKSVPLPDHIRKLIENK